MPPKPDVRRLLKKQQQERNKVAKITHPFAKYDPAGRLVCVVCNSNVKSEAVWQAHLGSQLHRDNIQKLKEHKQQQQLKRRAPSPSPPTASTQQSENKRIRVEDEQDRQNIEMSSDEEQEDEEMGLPTDFFDKQQQEEQEEEVEETPVRNENKNALPSGFFDDPEQDARVQGTLPPEEQARADLEKDVAMFNEAMMDVTEESKQVQEEDDETFWEERHFDIAREQANFDSRVEKLKQLRQTGQTNIIATDQEEPEDEEGIKRGLKSSVRHVLKSKPAKQVETVFDDDESEEESDDDWRAQQL